jgi:LysR family transcriptional regulator, low CO2-responsive transcriptional regulator
MNYTLHQLQVFLKVTQLKSITKAAEELYLSQPAVSIQLKNFQDQFEIPLTEVIGRQLHVTDFGNEIAIAAENILNEVYAINYKTLAYKGQLSGKLKISVVSTAKYIMPHFLSAFLKDNQNIELNLDVTNKSKVLESLEKNEVDFALVSILPENLKIEKLEIMPNKLFLVGNKDSKVKAFEKITDIFENNTFIYREEGSGTRFTMEKYLKKNKLFGLKKIELTSNEAVKQAIIAGFGVSIVPLIGIKNELSCNDLSIIPNKDFPITTTWNLIWLKNKKFSPVAQAYLDYITKKKEEIIDLHFKWIENY